ncbi:hypothetical protein POVWA1_026700 [Plasmodium ovale wallikeri]|uniref:UAS domain-containing protein n=1 Tax=Plasmodium ovale wallikeri TaxID=864142 RepID=A0A1A8YUU2_PLAOA|nr:hypothetical protein POVWA1_026700 [Plasmodium ovale wallikeri]
MTTALGTCACINTCTFSEAKHIPQVGNRCSTVRFPLIHFVPIVGPRPCYHPSYRHLLPSLLPSPATIPATAPATVSASFFLNCKCSLLCHTSGMSLLHHMDIFFFFFFLPSSFPFSQMCNGKCEDALELYYEINGEALMQSEGNYMGRKHIGEETTDGETKIGEDTKGEQGNGRRMKGQDDDKSTECGDYVRAADKHFSQALIHDMDASNFVHYCDKNKKERKNKIELGDTFGKLFSPPKFLISSLSLEDVRKVSKKENKYILVNIQDSEFDSLRLNRDIWNNDLVQEIIKNSFIFWLRHENDRDAIIFMNMYKVSKLPYICVLCKRTGRKLKVWNTKNFQDPICAQSQLYEFIETVETRNEVDWDNASTFHSTSGGEKTSKGEKEKTLSNCTGECNAAKGDELHVEEKKEKGDAAIRIDKDDKLGNRCEAVGSGGHIDQSAKVYNKINNELSELHRMRMHRFQKR